MLDLICLNSHYDSDSAKATTKNHIGFNDTKSIRSVAARRASLFVVSSLALLPVGEYARHNKLNLPLAQLFNFRIGCPNAEVRKESFLTFYAEYGKDFIVTLLEDFDPLNRRFKLIQMTDKPE